jgi:putative ABC transport system permease protein
MSYLLLIFKSAFRNRLRTSLTSLGVAIAIIAFLCFRTIIAAWHSGVEGAEADRMIVRNKISIIFPLPLSYVQKVRDFVGDKATVSWENWFGALYPKDEKGFFATLAADPDVFPMYPEFEIPPDQWKAYLEDRQGAIIGPRLAEKYGWKLGDRVTLRGTIYPGDWDFNVRAIYRAKKKSVDEGTFFFHWKYMNERLDARLKDQVGLILVQVKDLSQSQAVGQAIDKHFSNSAAETRTESEKEFQLEFLSMASAVVKLIHVISIAVLLILVLILANTMSMATRERTTEYAVMRAIGFHPRHIVTMVIGEGFVVALVGVSAGVALATPLMNFFGILLEKNMGGFMPPLTLEVSTVVTAVVAALALGMLAAALPAWRAGRLKIVDALRRVE